MNEEPIEKTTHQANGKETGYEIRFGRWPLKWGEIFSFKHVNNLIHVDLALLV